MATLENKVALGTKSVVIGLVTNSALAILKIVTGIVGNSYALVADGIESTADILSSLIVIRGLQLSSRKATADYHFGYGKAESVAAAAVSLMLLGAATAIAIEAVHEIVTPHFSPAPFTLIVLAFVIVVKEFLYRRVLTVAEEVSSTSLKGDAWHHRSDAISSLAAFIGISVALVGGVGWEAADDWAALLCSVIIAWNGCLMLRDAIADLMDRAPDSAVIEAIERSAQQVPGVLLVEKVLARKVGLEFFVDMHVHADPEMSLERSHSLSHKVKEAVRRDNPSVGNVIIHMEPADHP